MAEAEAAGAAEARSETGGAGSGEENKEAPPGGKASTGEAKGSGRSQETAALERWKKKDLSGVMLWFYRDKAGKRQGPFYPGQMRQWYDAGYLPSEQLVAPSFKGEVPREYAPLGDLFPTNPHDTAFMARDDIPVWPTAIPQPRDQDDDDDEDRPVAKRSDRPQWLEDSIDRQRKGIKRRMLYGPVEKEVYN